MTGAQDAARERAEFEDDYLRKHGRSVPRFANGAYRDVVVQARWEGWQARAARTSGVPEVQPDEVLYAIKRPDGYEDVHPDLLAHDAFRDFVQYRVVAARPAGAAGDG